MRITIAKPKTVEAPVNPYILTPEQFQAGISEARRMILDSAGYYFAGELTPFDNQLKTLALNALSDALERAKRTR